MKKIIVIFSLVCLVTTIAFAQSKNTQLSFNANLIDAYAAVEFSISEKSTLYAAIGFGAGSVSSINLNKYFDKREHDKQNSDVVLPEIFFAPYLNVQYRNYFANAKANNSKHAEMYFGARVKMYSSPVIVVQEDVKPIKENYIFGLMLGYKKVLGAQKRIVFNVNAGYNSHTNYNLSFFAFKPTAHFSIGYILN